VAELQERRNNSNDKPAILFFGNLPPPYGGLPSHFEFMVPKLIEAGYTPVILVRQPQDYSAWDDLGAFVYHFPEDPETIARESAAFQGRISRKQTAKVEELVKRLTWISEPDRFYGDLGFADRMARKHSVSFIHTYHVMHRSAVALTLKMLLQLPCYLTMFGEVVSDYAKDDAKKLNLRWMLDGFDALLASSQHCASGVELIGMSRDLVRVIPYGVDFDFFRRVDPSTVISRHNLQGGKVVLFQGRISREKGPQVLVDALPAVVKEFPNTVTLFVGPEAGLDFGPTGLTDALRQKVSDLQLDQHVVFVGSVPFDELPLYYSAADVLAFPSTSSRECMGLALKQAMACHIPVVAARAGGACEAVEDGVTGFCCRPNDPNDLARGLIAVLSSNNREHMGKAGYERGRRLFTQEKMLEDMLALYR